MNANKKHDVEKNIIHNADFVIIHDENKLLFFDLTNLQQACFIKSWTLKSRKKHWKSNGLQCVKYTCDNNHDNLSIELKLIVFGGCYSVNREQEVKIIIHHFVRY